MRRLLLALAAAAALWAVWWPLAAWRSVAETERWLEARRADGWQAEWAAVEISGFPLAYIRRVVSPALADPQGGWAWRADALTLSHARHPALSRPGLVVTFPQEQHLQTPWQRLTLSGGPLTAELALEGGAQRLDTAKLSAATLGVVSDAGWRMSLASGRLTAVARAGAPEQVTLTLAAADLALPSETATALRRAGLASGTVERIEGRAQITFDRPWDLRALEERRPQPRRIEVGDATLRWGALELRVAGGVDVAADGTPEGEIVVKATNWRDILAAARTAGALPAPLADAAGRALELASRLAGSPRTLDIPLSFSGGRTRLGPVPLGPAPRLTLP